RRRVRDRGRDQRHAPRAARPRLALREPESGSAAGFAIGPRIEIGVSAKRRRSRALRRARFPALLFAADGRPGFANQHRAGAALLPRAPAMALEPANAQAAPYPVSEGILYLVPTPLGDERDLSPRAIEVLRAVDLIAAEDTRITLRLLQSLHISKKLVSYHDHNETARAPWLVERLRAGQSVALVSDAGTPLVSDPGFRVVQAAAAAGVRVVPLPGPCAAVAALTASGLPTDRFSFIGFLPRDPGPRRAE